MRRKVKELDELLTRAGVAVLAFLMGTTTDQIVEREVLDMDREYEALCESA